MIKNFVCKETKLIWNGATSRKLPYNIQERAQNKLILLDAAKSLDDLKNPPGNNLEPLKGARVGQMSIRINDQWRICFTWEGNNAYDVEIVDYH